MIENGKIHLVCDCGKAIDYLVRRYTNYLMPRCASCGRHLKSDQSDMVSHAGVCYKAPKRLAVGHAVTCEGMRLCEAPVLF